LGVEQAGLVQTEAALGAQRRQRDQQREELSHQQRVANDLSRRIGGLESELETLEQLIVRTRAQRDEISQQLTDAQAELIHQTSQEEALQAREQSARSALNAARSSLQANERQLSELQQHAVDLQRQFTMTRERANVLQDLERRSEGLSPGVKDLLRQAQDAPLGALATVRGMVADLLRVDVRMAPLIDATLGELTQYVVIDGTLMIEKIASGEIQLKGRVGLLDLHVPGEHVPGEHQPAASELAIDGDRSVLGRAFEFVEAEPPYERLVRHLLSDCFCVETLQDALRLKTRATGSVRFVTRAGEILESNGRVLAGPRQATLGLVSRRSELRSLQHQLGEIEPEMRRAEADILQIKQQISSSEAQLDQLTSQYDQAASELMNVRVTSRAAADRVAALQTQLDQREQDAEQAETRRASAAEQRRQQVEKLDHANLQVAELDQLLAQYETRLVELEAERQQRAGQVTDVKVELAKSEQRIDSLRGQLVRYEEDHRERERARLDLDAQRKQACERQQSAERAILQASSALAMLWLRAESLQRELLDAHRLRAEQAEARRALQHRWDQSRRELQRQDESRHRLELEVNRIRMERDSLVQRVRDDYDIELSDIGESQVETETEQREREEIEREINELRRRLSNIGAVNMAALEEIEALEGRHSSLAGQYQDLVDAKDALARIIHKINADSRRLFTESLETIRSNFQSLFRRVFGGGHADIVLEEGMDILEAGIDIVATPPGKHSLGISLLSGGERALTAVTLLLAIFQYRPSPFCVLDEVDGPLDEANIGRFVDVLREFLQWTKFVVVTHSKKTMTAANTLYGVTMQESGVSKRVSVQFEDVSEDGHIRAEALQRDTRDRGSAPTSPDDDERGAA
jgi:chromosome segregation protein